MITLFPHALGQPAPTVGKILFDLRLQNPTDSTSALLAWPAPGDITANPANSTAVAAIFETLGGFQNAATAGTISDSASPQLGQSGEDFIENLKGVLMGKGFVFKAGFKLPPDFTSATKLRISVDLLSFNPVISPTQLPAAFEVWVRSTLLPSGNPALRWSIRELAALPEVQALLRAQTGSEVSSVVSQSIPENFSLIIVPDDGPLVRSISESNPAREPFTPIFTVAVAAAQTAVKEQILTKPRLEPNRPGLAQSLHQSFGAWPMSGDISFDDDLSVVDGMYSQQDRPAWVLRLKNFNPVATQSVAIDEIQLGENGRQSWAAFLAHQQAEGKNMDRLITQKTARETELATWLRQEMPWGPPHFATDEDHARRMAGLRQQSGVAAVNAKVFGQETMYAITWQPVLTTLEASGTYNSDRGGNISGKFSVQARDFGASAEGFIANRRRGLFADVSTTPALTHFPDQAMVTWGALGEYTRETPVRWGTPKSFSIRDEEYRTGVRSRIEGGKTVASPGTTARSRRWRLEAIAGYRRAKLAAENFAFVERAEAEAPFASLAFTGEWEHGPVGAKPVSSFHLDLAADASTAHASASSFARGQLQAVEEIRPWAERWENSLVRMTASGGFASDDTPLAWWYRLGGDERMRGFELGELTGRSFAHVATEVGVTIGAFLPPPTTTGPAGTPVAATPAPSGFNFRQIRILAGIEHAWIENPPAFIPSVNTVRDAFSYSLTAEYAGAIPALPNNAQLAIGYGYAPKSSHRSGRVFVSLRVPISIPQPH